VFAIQVEEAARRRLELARGNAAAVLTRGRSVEAGWHHTHATSLRQSLRRIRVQPAPVPVCLWNEPEPEPERTTVRPPVPWSSEPASWQPPPARPLAALAARAGAAHAAAGGGAVLLVSSRMEQREVRTIA
jgi:hypothetical protein